MIYNYRTKEYDSVPLPIDDWSDYIPQDVASQGLYEIYREEGKSSAEAAEKVLEIWAGNTAT
jgi:hypothetical protein